MGLASSLVILSGSMLALHPFACIKYHCPPSPGLDTPIQSPPSFLPCFLCGQILTLKTNISLRRMATVLKLPSQMLGLPFPGSAGGECFRSDPWWRRGGSVGSGRVGSSKGVGTPGGQHQEDRQEVKNYECNVINYFLLSAHSVRLYLKMMMMMMI